MTKKQRVLGMIGVVVLGALSQGLWELIKPLLGWSWTALLTIATLGLDTLRDGIYASAAASLGRASGIGTLAFALTAFIALTGATIIGYIKASFRPPSNPVAQYYFYSLFFIGTVFAVNLTRIMYVDQLASYYAKLETIAAPFLSDVEIKRFRSEYIQLSNRKEYLAHVEKLQALIRSNGGDPPTRDFF